ncbi:13354_t:CDS:1 [Entrophospora sp. SA101]|nr:13354_t:CDS:1 [Entrophospora sp. SA101]
MVDLFKNPEGEILDSIIPVGDKHWTLQFSNPGNLFKGEYPRIAPFILAQGRKIISSQIKPYKDKVRRVHTDGFILEEDPTKPPSINCLENASKILKTLKFEKESKCHVKNANQVTWYEC